MTQTTLIIIFLPLIVFSLFAGIYVYFGSRRARRAAALDVIKGRSDQSARAGTNPEEQRNKRRADLARKLKESEEQGQKSDSESYRALIASAGLGLSVPMFFGMSVAVGLLCGAAAMVFGMKAYLALMIAVIGGLGLPRVVLRILASRRQKKFLDDFADALDTIVRMLKAGMPVIESISMVSREFEGPIQEEMSKIYDEQKVGVPLYEAVQNAARRIPIPEMKMFATAISIQQQTGASLSDVLSNLAKVIRARFALKRKVKALSAEAKYSAGIIASLPVFVTCALYVMNPEYIMLLFTDSFGNMLLACGFGWMMIGVFIMRQMINFKV